MKMYAMLSLALLMSGMMYADSVTVTNNTDTNLYVELSFQSAQQGKNMTTGQAATVCYQGGTANGFIEKGKTSSVSFTTCGNGVNVNVFTTTAKGLKGVSVRNRTGIQMVARGKEGKITVSGSAGKYTIQ